MKPVAAESEQLSVKPLTDRAALDSLFADPYIARVGHDHRPAAYIDHPAVRYLGAWVGGSLVGAFCVIESAWIEWDLHVLLRRCALPHSRRLLRLCLDRLFSESPIERVTGYVLEGLESAKNYALRCGFVYEGFRRRAVSVGGRPVGIHVLGMTREDWRNTQ